MGADMTPYLDSILLSGALDRACPPAFITREQPYIWTVEQIAAARREYEALKKKAALCDEIAASIGEMWSTQQGYIDARVWLQRYVAIGEEKT